MKKLSFLLKVAALGLCIAAGTEQTKAQTVVSSGICGASGSSLTWVLMSDSTLTISGNGAMKDYDMSCFSNPPWYSSYRYRIKTVVIDNGVTSIGNYAFYDCKNLISIAIPSSVTKIGDRVVFNGTNSLTAINVDGNNSRYSSINGMLYNKAQDTLIECPNGKTGGAIIPNNVKSIGTAFIGCRSLSSVTIGDGVTRIETLNGLISLDSVTIGSSVTSIGICAFMGCNNLKSITCKAIVPPVLETNAFGGGLKNFPIHIPCRTLNAYQTSDWGNTFTNFVENCKGGRISGYVRHGKGHKSLSQKSVNDPAEDVSVHLQQDQSSTWVTVEQTLTNAEGYFEFGNISAGRYRVILDVDGLGHIDEPYIVNVDEGDDIQDIEYEITEEGIKNKSGDDVGIEQLRVTSYKLQVYPNPTNGQLRITNYELRESTTIEIYNVMGQKLLSIESLDSTETTIDVQHLANGMYFLKVGSQVVRFLKE